MSEEKIYRTMSFAGVTAVVTGVVVLVTGIAVGVISIIGGAKLLKDKKGLTF